MQYVALVVKYWPAVVAGLYLAYVVAAGDTAQIVPALTAFLAAAGLSQSTASAHAKLDALK
jgi:hypothetical protein